MGTKTQRTKMLALADMIIGKLDFQDKVYEQILVALKENNLDEVEFLENILIKPSSQQIRYLAKQAFDIGTNLLKEND